MLSSNSLSATDSSLFRKARPNVITGRVVQGHKNDLWLGLPRRLRQARRRAGLTASEVAVAIGWSSRDVAFLEAEGRRSSIDVLEHLAAVLGVSPCWLAYGDEGPVPFQQKRPRAEHDDYALTARVMAEACQGSAAYETPLHRGVGARLRYARELRGLSARALSRETGTDGVSVQSVLNTEAGETVPKVDNVEKLAAALGVAPCWLAFGVGDGPMAAKPTRADDRPAATHPDVRTSRRH